MKSVGIQLPQDATRSRTVLGIGGIDATPIAAGTSPHELHAAPEVPNQPWLDGFCVDKGNVRQFVAMPLHSGYTVEEQMSPGEVVGGIRLAVIPLKAAIYEQRQADPRLACSPEPLMEASVGCAGMGWAPAARSRSRSKPRLNLERIVS
jgi:hypothetical protein